MPLLLCQHCRTILPEAVFNHAEPVPCPGCQTPLEVRVFPAFARGPAVGQAAEALASEEEASCFYHPRKKAVVPCAECGRFLCALCDLELDGRHLCPACASGGGAAQTPVRVEGRRVLHDNIALALAALPFVTFVFWWTSLVCAPAALYTAVRYWNEPPRNPFGRSRVRLVLAALISLASIAGWVMLFYFLLQGRALPGTSSR